MSDAPSFIASAIAVAGSVAVAAIQRGAGAAAKEMVAQVEAKLGPRILALEAKATDVEHKIAAWEITLSAGVADARAAAKGTAELRTYVQGQLDAARRDWSAFKRELGRPSVTNEGATAEEVGVMARELGAMGRRLDDFHRDLAVLSRRLDAVDQELRDDRKVEGEKQRELGGLLATLRIILDDRKDKR